MAGIKKLALSLSRGNLLIRLGFDKLFPYILYTFLLAVCSIWLSYKAEVTMQKAENNKRKIENLKIENLNKTCDIISLTRISTVEKLLDNSGSEIKAPVKPAYRIQ